MIVEKLILVHIILIQFFSSSWEMKRSFSRMPNKWIKVDLCLPLIFVLWCKTLLATGEAIFYIKWPCAHTCCQEKSKTVMEAPMFTVKKHHNVADNPGDKFSLYLTKVTKSCSVVKQLQCWMWAFSVLVHTLSSNPSRPHCEVFTQEDKICICPKTECSLFVMNANCLCWMQGCSF